MEIDIINNKICNVLEGNNTMGKIKQDKVAWEILDFANVGYNFILLKIFFCFGATLGCTQDLVLALC